jgi:hypothetical protein
MNNTTLHLHVWLEIKWHHFQLASGLFRFELQQVILAVVYVEVPDLYYVSVLFFVTCVYSEYVSK